MKTPTRLLPLLGLLSTALTVTVAGQATPKEGQNPAEHLPAHIRRVTWFGERADWSHDGKRILFVEKTFGDVYEVDPAAGIIRALTHHYPQIGRAPSELQSQSNLVCRLLLEKKKTINSQH